MIQQDSRILGTGLIACLLAFALLLPAPPALAAPQADSASSAPVAEVIEDVVVTTDSNLVDRDVEQELIDQAVREVYPAIVRIDVVTTEAVGGRMRKFRASGSGTIISAQGHVLTNHHVAGKATRLRCRLADRRELNAELVGADPLTDLAVLKLDLSDLPESAGPLPVARFGDSDTLRLGQRVLAMGSPAGVSQSVTMGIVANTELILPGPAGLRMDGEPVGALVRWIGHDAVIFHGNSGGPLVNLDGEVVGVNEVGLGSLGGAIPSNLAESVAEQLIRDGEVRRSWVGLDTQPMLESFGEVEGVLVAGVIEPSPAGEAGIAPGDIITRFDGQAVSAENAEDLPLFNRVVLSTPVGETVTVNLLRDGEPMTLTLTTEAREPARGDDRELKTWGLAVRDFTRTSALEMERDDRLGVLVQSVRQGGQSTEAKPELRPGDVIVAAGGVDVENVKELIDRTREIVADADQRVPTLITFDRGGQQMVTVVKLGLQKPEEKTPSASKAWLGARTQVLVREIAAELGLPGKRGVRITQVLPNSPAEAAGLQVGDVLLKLDGRVISARQEEDIDVFDHLIRQYRIGSEVELTVWREGEMMNIPAALAEKPTPPAELDEYKDVRFEFEARDLSFDDRVDRRLDIDQPGVLIRTVQPAGWADLAGLNAGDVLLEVQSEPVGDIDQLESVMDRIAEEKPERVTLFIRRGIHTMFLELEPDWAD